MVSLIKKILGEFCCHEGVFDWKEWHAVLLGFFEGCRPRFRNHEDKVWKNYEDEWHYYRVFKTIGEWCAVAIFLHYVRKTLDRSSH